MEIFRKPLIVNIVFMLLQCTSSLPANCSIKEYRLLPGGYNLFLSDPTQSEFKANKFYSITECAILCMNENLCKLWRFGNETCQIFHMKDKVTASISSNSATMTYYEKDEDSNWIQVFFVKEGSGFNVASAFLGKQDYKSWGPATCTNIVCPDLYRNPLIDIWNILPIKKVRLSLIKNNMEVLNLIFNGQGTNSSNWFSMDRVLESPWNAFGPGAVHNVFILDLGPTANRAFYISLSHGGCSVDLGWLSVTEKHETCPWGQTSTYPQFFYSNKKTATNWHTEHGLADALAVYISL